MRHPSQELGCGCLAAVSNIAESGEELTVSCVFAALFNRMELDQCRSRCCIMVLCVVVCVFYSVCCGAVCCIVALWSLFCIVGLCVVVFVLFSVFCALYCGVVCCMVVL